MPLAQLNCRLRIGSHRGLPFTSCSNRFILGTLFELYSSGRVSGVIFCTDMPAFALAIASFCCAALMGVTAAFTWNIANGPAPVPEVLIPLTVGVFELIRSG